MSENALTSVAILGAGSAGPGSPNGINIPFRIEVGAFLYVVKGEGQVYINLGLHNIKEQDFITLLPGSVVRLLDYSHDFQAYYIVFSNQFTRDLDLWKNTLHSLSGIIENPVLSVSNPDNATLVKSYCAMLHEIYTKENITFKAEIMKNMLEAVMFAISGLYQDMAQPQSGKTKLNRNHELFKNFMSLVSRHYEKEREVAFYADKMCITPKHLGYVVKSVSGGIASDLISTVVVMDAKSKLKHTELSVRQISDSLNFPNPSFFGKYFKKHVGVTPKEYRDGKNAAGEDSTIKNGNMGFIQYITNKQ